MHRLPQPDDLELALRLPTNRPWRTAEALDLGVTPRQLRRLLEVGLIRRPFKGVYAVSSVEDCVESRLEILRLVVPPNCVVTDRTAGWVWAGDRMLAPNEHLQPPPLSVFCKPGHRLRSGLTASGERTFLQRDLVEIDGLVLTNPLRTALDLGRLLHRDQAFAALDTLAAAGRFGADELAHEERRFVGYRGVRQLRAFMVLVDPRSQSQFESILRLRWYDTGLPRPECQIEVETPWGAPYFVDIGLPGLRYGAEYDGEAFHGAAQGDHDATRRAWLATHGEWAIDVVRKFNMTGPAQDVYQVLRRGYDKAVRAAR